MTLRKPSYSGIGKERILDHEYLLLTLFFKKNTKSYIEKHHNMGSFKSFFKAIILTIEYTEQKSDIIKGIMKLGNRGQ